MRIEQLGARLKAYVETLLTITTLRLCNRFGTGDHCHVNKLPTELVELIEGHIVGPEREDALGTYSKALRCCEGTCEPIDHYTQEEMYEEYHSKYGCLDVQCELCASGDFDDHEECDDIGACNGDKCPAWKYDHELDLRVFEELEIHSDKVQQRCWDSQDVLISFPIPKEQRKLLIETHFGIIVTSNLWRPEGMSEENWTYTSYLTLPGNIIRQQKWAGQGEREIEPFGFGMPVNVPAPPTEQSLSRFPRALKILGLQAWTHPSLEDQAILSPPATGEEGSEIDGKDLAQPQLTFLVTTDYE